MDRGTMSDARLMQAYYTHPQRMVGTRLQQHDNVHRQLGAYDELVRRAAARQSTEELHPMLRVVAEGVPSVPRGPWQRNARNSTGTSSAETEGGIDNLKLSELREAVDRLRQATSKQPRNTGLQREEELHAVRFFESFFAELERAVLLKRYFDRKIYACLYTYFYYEEVEAATPSSDLDLYVSDEMSGSAGLPADEEYYNTSDRDSETYPERQAWTEDIPADNRQTHANANAHGWVESASVSSSCFSQTRQNKMTADEMKLGIIVRDMYALNQRWQRLLTIDDVDNTTGDVFEQDSTTEDPSNKFSDSSRLNYLYRLLPDVHLKSHKAAELARRWWTLANRIHHQRTKPHSKKKHQKKNTGAATMDIVQPQTSSAHDNFQRQLELSESRLATIEHELSEAKQLAATTHDDLDQLKQRHDRYAALMEQYRNVEAKKWAAEIRHEDATARVEDITTKLRTMPRDADDFVTTRRRLVAAERELQRTTDEIDMTSYQLQLLRDDLNVELEIRAELVKLTTRVEEKVRRLRELVKAKSREREEAEKCLADTQARWTRIQEIVQRYGTDDNAEFDDVEREDKSFDPQVLFADESGVWEQNEKQAKINAIENHGEHKNTHGTPEEHKNASRLAGERTNNAVSGNETHKHRTITPTAVVIEDAVGSDGNYLQSSTTTANVDARKDEVVLDKMTAPEQPAIDVRKRGRPENVQSTQPPQRNKLMSNAGRGLPKVSGTTSSRLSDIRGNVNHEQKTRTPKTNTDQQSLPTAKHSENKIADSKQTKIPVPNRPQKFTPALTPVNTSSSNGKQSQAVGSQPKNESRALNVPGKVTAATNNTPALSPIRAEVDLLPKKSRIPNTTKGQSKRK